MAFFLTRICNLHALLQNPEYLFASEGSKSLALMEALFEAVMVTELGWIGRLKVVIEPISWELRDGLELVIDRAS